MSKENSTQILKIIHKNKKSLTQYGVKRLGLFGSYARGENTKKSDIDFVVDFKKETFDAYMGLKIFLEDLFKKKIDLVISNSIKSDLKSGIMKDVIYAKGI